MSDARLQHPDALVSTDWLEANLAEPTLRIFDCTTYLAYAAGSDRPYDVVSGRADFDAAHIPGSGFLDLQGELSDKSAPTNFMMPAAADLAAAFAGHGIGDGARVVLYSRKTMIWSSRVWWMLRAIGFDNAAVLDGGWEKWAAEDRPTSAEPAAYSPAAVFAPQPRPELFADKAAVQAAIGDGATCTINALAPDLHSGENPRYGRAGRIPGSVNVPAATLMEPETKALVSAEAAAAAFAAAGAAPDKQIIIYCGGGIAATLDAFLMHQLGYRDIAIYDASMSEWAKDEALPIETD